MCMRIESNLNCLCGPGISVGAILTSLVASEGGDQCVEGWLPVCLLLSLFHKRREAV